MKTLHNLFPQADFKIVQLVQKGRELFEKYEVNTDRRFRMFLAQMAHESGEFRYFKERGYYNKSFEDMYGYKTHSGKILGNTLPGDGEKYKGRGIIQLTGKYNYTFYGMKVGVDLVNHPDRAAEPKVALEVALCYFQNRGCNKAADKQDVTKVTRLINGGKNGLKDRQRLYKMLEGVRINDYM